MIFVQKETNEVEEFESLVLLDSESNTTVFCERRYVTKVWDINETIEVEINGDGYHSYK